MIRKTGAAHFSQELRRLCHEFVQHKWKVTSRIKVHFQTINGAHVQWIMKAHAVLENLAKEHQQETAACAPDRIASIDKLRMELTASLETQADNFADVYNSVVDVVEKEE